jgi:hypothetical protein
LGNFSESTLEKVSGKGSIKASKNQQSLLVIAISDSASNNDVAVVSLMDLYQQGPTA